jgi:hypothetical protein
MHSCTEQEGMSFQSTFIKKKKKIRLFIHCMNIPFLLPTRDELKSCKVSFFLLTLRGSKKYRKKKKKKDQ